MLSTHALNATYDSKLDSLTRRPRIAGALRCSDDMALQPSAACTVSLLPHPMHQSAVALPTPALQPLGNTSLHSAVLDGADLFSVLSDIRGKTAQTTKGAKTRAWKALSPHRATQYLADRPRCSVEMRHGRARFGWGGALQIGVVPSADGAMCPVVCEKVEKEEEEEESVVEKTVSVGSVTALRRLVRRTRRRETAEAGGDTPGRRRRVPQWLRRTEDVAKARVNFFDVHKTQLKRKRKVGEKSAVSLLKGKK